MHIPKKILISTVLSVIISYGIMYACHQVYYLYSGMVAIAIMVGMQTYIILTLKEQNTTP